ncbi:MAG: hypothetical protein HY782_27145 [Chloroflexi bacterium]|nr:hypothetical protein [Chloroflexota bacterium]
MDYRVDGKGKFYTQKVSKQAVSIVARVENTLIHGVIHLTPENRLKDEMNNGEEFVAITKAQVLDAATERVMHAAEVLIVNKARIAWILPAAPSATDTTLDTRTENAD